MEARYEDKNKSGIYSIINTINGKCYVGKSVNIYQRIKAHHTACLRRDKDENRHLINAYHLYSEDAFTYIVLEYTENLEERELYWIVKTNNCDTKRGYNMRLDTKSGMKVSDSTKKLMSEIGRKRFKDNPELYKKMSEQSKKYFSDPVNLKNMAKAVSKSKKKKSKFFRFTREGVFIEEFDTCDDIIEKYPNYKWQNIYAACNGNKPTYMDSLWRKVPKNEDIVSYILKDI